MYKYLLVLLCTLVLMPTTSYSKDVAYTISVGKSVRSTVPISGAGRLLSFTATGEIDLGPFTFIQYNTFKGSDDGKRSHLFVVGSAFVNRLSKEFFLELDLGIGYLTRTTSRLGTHYQFKNAVALGFFPSVGSSQHIMRLEYTHISNGGLDSPDKANSGEDFTVITYGIMF